MIRSFVNKIENYFSTPVAPHGLVIFRIAYATVLFLEVMQLYQFRHLIYDRIPFIVASEIDWSWPLSIWMFSIVLVGVGAFYRTATLVNYLIGLFCIGTIATYEYHMFYAYMGLNFLLMFIPAAASFSVDNLRRKVLAARLNQPIPATKVSLLSFKVIILLGVGLVYFDSIFHKLGSWIWTGGLGAWLPASLPMVTKFDSSFLMDNKFVALTSGYGTILFELIFIFLFWFRKFWLPLLVVGVGLHVGILMEFPIPWFALGVTSLYFLLVPPDRWEKLFSLLTQKEEPSLEVWFDAKCPLCRSTRAVLESFDWKGKVRWRPLQEIGSNEPQTVMDQVALADAMYSIELDSKKSYEGVESYREIFRRSMPLVPFGVLLSVPPIKWIANIVYQYIASTRSREVCSDEVCGVPATPTFFANPTSPWGGSYSNRSKARIFLAFVLTMFIAQSFMIVKSPIVKQTAKRLGMENSIAFKAATLASGKISDYSKPLLGVTSHGVFMDGHFDGYNHQIKVVHRDTGITVPVCTPDGVPSSYCQGALWVKWTFRVVGGNVSQERLKRGLRDFSAFWVEANGRSLDEKNDFDIYCRTFHVPKQWEAGYYEKQMAQPWIPVGEMTWEKKEFSVNIAEIEQVE